MKSLYMYIICICICTYTVHVHIHMYTYTWDVYIHRTSSECVYNVIKPTVCLMLHQGCVPILRKLL